ncbi:MAG: tryptophan--tRNA ligase [Candidatus Diapherotrites archaeon]|uniref:Tryptophan--tRNA ligase n=1 Tax=Candidatus Iainarchaeum sp. TaxID=3101447 RepID=A0A939C963_9ARCH|nr:tryptophan--tRNA ligase [Candidatus Diapherotrites archaeon]
MPKIDPWGSSSISNYQHVFSEFGLSQFPESMRKQLKHRFFQRNIVIAHRDFEKVLQRIKSRKRFINITGIASSGQYHLGHKADIDLFKFFKSQGAINYFCVCDLDAYASRPKIKTLQDAKEIAVQNAADALALGLGERDIYVQSNKEKEYYCFAFELGKKITASTFEAIYGHLDLGKVSANLLQYADILHGQLPSYSGKMPSITGIGLDQDPHARAVRDLAKRLPCNLEVPSFIYFRHQSGLKEGSKMSSSEPDTAIFLNDSEADVKRKIANCFTGGRNTAEEQRKLGGKPEICKKYEIDLFHLESDAKLRDIFEKCKSGERLCGECKQLTAAYLSKFLKQHQAKAKKSMPKAKKIVFG